MTLNWKPLTVEDIESVDAIANIIHPGLPERKEVFAEKITIFPDGCRKLASEGGDTVGYGVSHPWMLHSIPPLDEFLNKLPEKSDCIYIHDVAILPEFRGHKSLNFYVEHIKSVSIELNISKLTCVSVYGTDVLWNRFGFKIETSEQIRKKIETYGSSAKYMIADV